jgi:hypothetical protein
MKIRYITVFEVGLSRHGRIFLTSEASAGKMKFFDFPRGSGSNFRVNDARLIRLLNRKSYG